jgi:cytochrome c-type biogenesis protein CcmH
MADKAVFLIAALVLVALVLTLVLRPLWRTTRGVALALGAAVVCSAAALYFLVGTPAALDPAALKAPTTLADAVGRLEAQLATTPDDAEGWRLLGRAYAAQAQPAKARDAFAHAATLTPDDTDVLAEAAEASALADPHRRFDARAVGWLRHALDVQPRNQRARWLLGVSQRQAGQPAQAAATWEPLLAEVDPQTAVPLREQVDAARQAAGLPPLTAAAVADKSAGALLRVTVELAPRLRATLGPADVLFVLARQPNGPPMPLAVKRLPAKDFPVTVELGDGDSPMPTMKLSQAGNVELVARISRQGVATRAAGDLESVAKPAQPKPGARYALRIDQVVK